jgi:hypothetical protein
MGNEIQMWKGRSKVGSINIRLSGTLGEKETMTARTKDIDGIVSRRIRQAHGQYGLALAKHVWTPSKRSSSVFLVHGMHTSVRKNIPTMQQQKTKVGEHILAHGRVAIFDNKGPSRPSNVPSVNQSVQHFRCRFYNFLLLFRQGIFHGHFDIKDHIQGVIIIWHRRVEPREIKVVL